jgi:hypothetical protein
MVEQNDFRDGRMFKKRVWFKLSQSCGENDEALIGRTEGPIPDIGYASILCLNLNITSTSFHLDRMFKRERQYRRRQNKISDLGIPESIENTLHITSFD